MAAQKGREILLKIDTAASGGPTFTTYAGIRSRTVTINRETVDITNSDSAGMWREFLPDAGVRSMSASGGGVFTGGAAVAKVVDNMINGTTNPLQQVIVPGLGTFQGRFALSSTEFSGEYNGEAAFSTAIESAGEITFTEE